MVLVMLACVSPPSYVSAQRQCTPEEAFRRISGWEQTGDEYGIGFVQPKAQYQLLWKKADQIIALLNEAVPRLTGAEGHPYRTTYGQPYVANGPVPFALNVPIFDYYCIPQTSGNPNLRGKIELSGETGTWIYFYFNSLGWLTSNYLHYRTVNGARIYEIQERGEALQGFTLLRHELNVGVPNEAIIITPGGRSPLKPLSREKYLLARQKFYQGEISKLQTASPASGSELARHQHELDAITNLLNSLTPEERQGQAIIKDPNAMPGDRWAKVFVTEAEGGHPLVTVDAALFKPRQSAAAVTIITVYWRTDHHNAAESEAIRQFKGNFDFQALRQMLDK